MPSSTEESAPAQRAEASGWVERAKLWNRRLHYDIGLMTLFYVWLFSLSGLLLNHQWSFAEFWPDRPQSQVEREIGPPAHGSDLDQARDLMRQLGLRGEIEWTTTRAEATRFDFRVSRPGEILDVRADLARNRATVQRIGLNLWGVTRMLHSFTGVRMDDPRNGRDWVLTSIWALAMDGVAAGLILMVLSSLAMWFELRSKRFWGAIALAAGWLSCALFCVGLRWLF
ncbi:MAG: hypothetical protein FJ387_13420 [Verrucomicrobia bacterium]|nr:hypothetical protein [Verrucomicrobiota bacterium]